MCGLGVDMCMLEQLQRLYILPMHLMALVLLNCSPFKHHPEHKYIMSDKCKSPKQVYKSWKCLNCKELNSRALMSLMFFSEVVGPCNCQFFLIKSSSFMEYIMFSLDLKYPHLTSLTILVGICNPKLRDRQYNGPLQ